MPTSLRTKWWEPLCFVLLLALVGFQVYLPPVTGLANNSDFAYVIGKLQLCPADQNKYMNIYLQTDYFFDPVSCTWDMGLVSIEVPLMRLATYISKPFTGEKKFDLRALASIHLAMLLTAFAILLALTRRAVPAVRYVIPALFILIFSDVAYTCYLNSVYLDAPAYLLLLCTTSVAVAACLNHHSRLAALGFLLFGLSLIFSKTQHAILGVEFAALALWLAFREAKRQIRVRWAVIAVLLTASTVTTLSMTPPRYRLFAMYDVIFSRIAPHDVAPWEVLEDVGLSDLDLKYIDTNAETPGAPVYDEQWANAFLHRTSFGKLIVYYLQNPDVVLREMNSDLHLAAPVLRPTDMANYRAQDGFPPRTMATRFSLWSNIRSALLREFPYHVLLIYLAPWIALAAGWKWRWLRSPLLPLGIMLSVAGIGEFTMSTLTDALDNSRHLFVFQVITEMLFLMIVAALLNYFSRRKMQLAEKAIA
jgi:hypothetical protein